MDIMELYTPLSVAREEIKKRWKDKELQKKVKAYLGGSVPDPFKENPRAVLSRNIITPNFELFYFLDLAKISKLKPIGLEGSNDKFCTKNSDKVSLAKLSFLKKESKGKGKKAECEKFNTRMIDMMGCDGKKFRDIKTLWGEKLVDFHHRMLDEYGCQVDLFDDFEWFSQKGKRSNPKQYYENFLALFLCHGILFENFHDQGKEVNFTEDIIIKNFLKIKDIFGMKPLIVPLVPREDEGQLYYWNSYLITK